MALNTPRGWLITYDITHPKRLARLHRFLVKHATPVQYSVFHFEGSTAQMGRLMDDIDSRIDPSTDDVRGYQLPERLSIDTLGRGSLPGNALVLSATSPSLQQLLARPTKLPTTRS
ncbi:MAG TPA: CRISPR-associated endonuclease Cas2 [Pseudothauera hydrothermalis]|jgi:CRISPR-associated protein Cas2|nr:CRISPR-associated endonuclease Cas2 [Rhodocyclaceae bacterium]AVZ79431.1 CRISPR-associated endonuclease Cas2 [Zoogloeaceae bacteirum Par-f-2]HNQ75729.1 CRISPR-associated endonuclease Cas2 [Pseudothauera hydrothermalis]